MSTFGAMITRIANELSNDAVASRIPDAIKSAITYYETERFWFTEGESTASTVIGQAAYAVPTDLIEPDQLTYTDSNSFRQVLTRRSWSWMREHDELETLKAAPCDWCVYADQLWLYPRPDAVYTLTMSFLKRLTALSAFADTNGWMTHGEELIRNHAKHDLMSQPGYHATALQVQICERARDRALDNLRYKSSRRISTDRLSLDPALVGGEPFNIYKG